MVQDTVVAEAECMVTSVESQQLGAYMALFSRKEASDTSITADLARSEKEGANKDRICKKESEEKLAPKAREENPHQSNQKEEKAGPNSNEEATKDDGI